MKQENSKWLVVVNPNAGIGKGQKDWDKISGILMHHQFDYKAVFTTGRLHALNLTIEHIEKEGFRQIIVVGGDGTMNEVVNGVLSQKAVESTAVTLGMISVGTGNDWVRTFHIPTHYAGAIKIIKKQKTMLQDAGIVRYMNGSGWSERFFVNMAGMGFDGLVASKTNADKEKGRSNPLLYFKHIFTSLFAFQAIQTRIVVDDRVLNENIFSMGIAIGQYNGGGMMQAPDARVDDGLFDLTLIKKMSKWSIVASVRRLYDGSIGKHKKVEILTGKKIRIEPELPILLEADGESLGQSPFEFDIIPRSLRVIVNYI